MLRQAGLLLPAPFVSFQIERGVSFESRRTPILRAAEVAHQRIGNDKIQNNVDQRGEEENGKRKDQFMVTPSNTTRRQAERHDADAKPLRKIFPHEKVFART